MIIWMFAKAIFLLFSFASASPPGSPQSQESSYGELVDNPHSEYFHHPHVPHTTTSTDKSYNSQAKHVLKPRPPSPALQQTRKKSTLGYDRKSVIHQLLTDPSSDYYHYIKLLSPPREDESTKQTIVHPSVEAKSNEHKKRKKVSTDQEKLEKYEARLLKMRTTVSQRRKEALSGVSKGKNVKYF